MIISSSVNATGTKITLTWVRVPNALGYVFTVDGRAVSRTYDPAKTSTVFGLLAGSHDYGVVALIAGDSGAVTYPPPPPPPPMSVNVTGVPIQGQTLTATIS